MTDIKVKNKRGKWADQCLFIYDGKITLQMIKVKDTEVEDYHTTCVSEGESSERSNISAA